MTLSNIEKSAVVLTLLGGELSEKIINRLPKEIVERVQNDVLPLIGNVNIPPDVDGFVLDEIIKPAEMRKSTLDNAPDEKGATTDIKTGEDQPAVNQKEEQKAIDINWDIIGEQELYKTIPDQVVMSYLRQEKPVYYPIILSYFPEDRRGKVIQQLKQNGLYVQEALPEKAFIKAVQHDMQQVCYQQLKNYWKQVVDTSS